MSSPNRPGLVRRTLDYLTKRRNARAERRNRTILSVTPLEDRTVPSLTATISPSENPIASDGTVTFTASISGGTAPYYLSWETGGAVDSSTSDSITVTYYGPQNATVSLQVWDSASNSATTSIVEDVGDGLTASASATPTTAAVGTVVDFTGTASSGSPSYQYLWDFGDGTSSASQDPTHSYSTAGTYSVTLTVTDADSATATSSFEEVVTSGDGLTASASATPTTADVGTVVDFTGTASSGSPSYQYSWDFGDGTSSASQDPTHSYSTAGTYTVTLTVTDADSATSTSSFDEVVNSGDGLTASASGTPNPVALGATVSFTGSASSGSPSYEYLWTFGDGSSSASQDPTHNYSTAGTYAVTLTVTDAFGDTSTSSFDEVVNSGDGLTASASGTPSTADVGATVDFTGSASSGSPSYEYMWNFGDGTTSSSQDPTHTYTTPGTYTAVLTVTDANSATSTSSVSETVTTDPTTLSLSSSNADSTYGQSVTLTAAVSSTYPGTPTGTVTFMAGNTTLGTAPVSDGAASLTLDNIPAGTTSVSASYNGDSTFAPSSASTSQTVAQAQLTITANNETIVYGSSSNFNGYTVSGLLGSDSVSSVQFTTNASTSGSGNWSAGSWTISASSATGSGLSNYAITYAPGTLTVTPLALTISGFTANNKVYDSTMAAAIASNGTLVGVVPGDLVSLNSSNASASFANPNVGTAISVTASGFTLTGGDSIDYTLPTQPTNTANITAAPLTITANGVNATYGGANNYGGYTSTGLLGSDSISNVSYSTNATSSCSGHWNAGTWSITASSASGPGLSNYTITYVPGTLTVSPQSLTVSGFAVNNKTYDSTTTATISSVGSLSGVISGDNIGLNTSGATATFATPSVGVGIVVSASGLALSGADTSDYTLTQPTTAANITLASLTITANNVAMTYADGTTLSDTSGFIATGLVGSDSVTSVQLSTNATSSSSGHWNAGTWSITPTSASGSGLSNYTITYVPGTLTVSSLPLTVTGFAVNNKTYDSTTAATISSVGSLSGVIQGDNVSLSASGAVAAFASPSVGNGVLASASGLSLAGADAGDYTLTQPSATANITPASLTISANSETLIYGGGNIFNSYTFTGLLGSDSVTSVQLATNDSTDSSGNWQVGNFTITPSAASGSGLSNYTITYVNGTLTVSQLTVSGTVFVDLNNDGTDDTGDPGVSGVQVAIVDASGNTVGTTTTSANGSYTVACTAAGQFTLELTAPSGYVLNGSLTTESEPVTVINGNPTIMDVPAYVASQPATVSGTVWVDVSGDDDTTADYGAAGLTGVQVTLLTASGGTVTDASGNPVGSTTTDANGSYSFGNLMAGNYEVSFSAPTGYDFDVSSSGTVTATAAAPGPNAILDEGVYQPDSLTGVVWVDLNQDGMDDSGDPGLPNAGVTLLNQAGSTVASTTTASDGSYSFLNLAPGYYSVQFVAPSGYVMSGTSDEWTGSISLISDDNNTLGAPAYASTSPVTVSGSVWVDSTGSGQEYSGETGMPGVGVTLETSSGTPIESTSTDANGTYSFSGLSDGTYTVAMSAPTGYSFDGSNTSSWSSTASTPGPGSTLDEGIYQPASVSGVAWLDANGDGLEDDGETGLAGVNVAVIDQYGNRDGTAITAADGSYTITGLAPGSYTVQFSAPAGDLVEGSNAATGSQSVTLVTDQSATTNSAIFSSSQTASVSGQVWIDTDGSGVDDGNPGLAGVSVAVIDQNGDTVATAETGSDGDFNVSGLPYGVYTINLAAPSGYLFDGGQATWSGTATTPGTASVVNVGAYQPGILTGTVWVGSSGGQQPGDLGLSGAFITLTNTAGTEVGQAQTDDGGGFQISGLAPGSYTLEVDCPSGYVINGSDQTSWTQSVTIDSGTTSAVSVGTSAGYSPASLTGNIWVDLNDDDTDDSGDPALPGVIVTLLDSNNNVIGSTTSDSSGDFTLSNIQPGTYTVQLVAPSGYDLSGASATLSASDNLSSGTNTLDVAAYADTQTTAITGNIWVDANGDDTDDQGDPDLPGVEIILSSNGVQLATTESDSSGNFSFSGLAAGSYTLQFTAPSGFDFEGPQANTWTATIANPGPESTVSLGAYQTASISGEAWLDSNDSGQMTDTDPGVPGVEVSLLDASGDVIGSTTTNSSGEYTFSGLAPGTFSLEWTAPSSDVFEDTTGTADYSSVTLGSDQSSTLNDALISNSLAGSISGNSWVDINQDGADDSNDPGLAGLGVAVLDGNGNTIASTSSSSNGSFSLTGVSPGSYILQFTAPYGYNLSGSTTVLTEPLTLSPGQADNVAVPAYPTSQLGTISGQLWLDSLGTGSYVSGDAGLSSQTVNLLNSSGVLVASQTTNASGQFTFSGLAAGAYNLSMTVPGGDVFESNGLTTLSDVVNTPGSNTTVSVPVEQTAAVSGLAFVESSGNPGLPGVQVSLYSASGALAGTATTQSTGGFSFANLLPGSYQALFNPPTGYSLATVPTGTLSLLLSSGQTDSSVNVGFVSANLTAGDLDVTTTSDTAVDVNELSIASETGTSNPITLVSYTQPSNGTVTENYDDTLQYTPATGFVGVDNFAYTVTNGAQSATGWIQVNVNAQAQQLPDVWVTPGNNAVEGSPNGCSASQPSQNGTFTISRNSVAGFLYVDYVMSGAAGTYQPVAGEVVFTPGQENATVTIVPITTSPAFNAGDLTLTITDAQNPTTYTVAKTPNTRGNATIAVNAFAGSAITGTVFQDINANGIQNAGEPGEAGLQVIVYKQAGSNFDPTAITSLTDQNGQFTLGTLQSGVYKLFYRNVPAGLHILTSGMTAVNGGFMSAPITIGTTSGAIVTTSLRLVPIPAAIPSGPIIGPTVVPGMSMYSYSVWIENVQQPRGLRFVTSNSDAAIVYSDSFTQFSNAGIYCVVYVEFLNTLATDVVLTLKNLATNQNFATSPPISVVTVAVANNQPAKFANLNPVDTTTISGGFGDGIIQVIPVPGQLDNGMGIQVTAAATLTAPSNNPGAKNNIQVGLTQTVSVPSMWASYTGGMGVTRYVISPANGQSMNDGGALWSRTSPWYDPQATTTIVDRPYQTWSYIWSDYFTPAKTVQPYGYISGINSVYNFTTSLSVRTTQNSMNSQLSFFQEDQFNWIWQFVSNLTVNANNNPITVALNPNTSTMGPAKSNAWVVVAIPTLVPVQWPLANETVMSSTQSFTPVTSNNPPS